MSFKQASDIFIIVYLVHSRAGLQSMYSTYHNEDKHYIPFHVEVLIWSLSSDLKTKLNDHIRKSPS